MPDATTVGSAERVLVSTYENGELRTLNHEPRTSNCEPRTANL
jgi:hypothetical protein